LCAAENCSARVVQDPQRLSIGRGSIFGWNAGSDRALAGRDPIIAGDIGQDFTSVKIAMVDPSLFTLPYDTALCRALRLRQCDVTLHGRPLRPLEVVPAEDRPRPSFYRWSEGLRVRVPNKVFQSVKGCEHALDTVRAAFAFRANRPDIVHFQWSALPAVDIFAIRHLRRSVGPVVLTVHDMAPFNNAPTSVLQRIGSTGILREFDHLIVHSESSRELLASRGLSAERISVVPHGILNVISAPADPVVPDAPLTMLMFGRVKTYKGVDMMIEALGRLPAALRRRCRLLVVGEPMIPVEPMKRRAEALGIGDNITWDLRYVSEENMAEVFSQADIFAFPYREIDTSGVLMSCLPYGKPIIASEIGAFQKLLQDRVHGRVIPPGDPEALSDAISSLVSNPALMQACGKNVGFLSEQIPSWDTIAGQTIRLYERLLRQRASAAYLGDPQPMTSS
jgi:glycosyltransferase involved in cell wall biosynthesis